MSFHHFQLKVARFRSLVHMMAILYKGYQRSDERDERSYKTVLIRIRFLDIICVYQKPLALIFIALFWMIKSRVIRRRCRACYLGFAFKLQIYQVYIEHEGVFSQCLFQYSISQVLIYTIYSNQFLNIEVQNMLPAKTIGIHSRSRIYLSYEGLKY